MTGEATIPLVVERLLNPTRGGGPQRSPPTEPR